MNASLIRKLQLKPRQKMVVLNAPNGYYDQLTTVLPEATLNNLDWRD